MKKITYLIFLFSLVSYSQAKQVLIYHETNGFRHGSINNGITLITNQGIANGLWTTDDSQNSNVFTAANLAQYDAVIWLNTSGNNLLTAAERTAFENFIINGGGFVGVHAATDTYTMTVLDGHPAVGFLGSSWNKNEEYYYWQNNGGQLSTDNTVLLEVESTGSNSYDAARPIAWYKEAITVGGTTYSNIKSIYTALGHNGSDYNNDSDFQMHIEEAVKWAINEGTLGIAEQNSAEFTAYPNPMTNSITLNFRNTVSKAEIKIHNVLGKLALEQTIFADTSLQGAHTFDLSDLKSGVYLLTVKTATGSKTIKLVKL